MKRIFWTIFLIAVSVNLCFTQAPSKKTARTLELEKLLAKREKFDPARNPNDDFTAAITRAKKENKRIILDIGGEWCSWCIKMDLFLMQNPTLDKLREKNFVWLKINMSEENENKEFLSKYPEIGGYPHLFVLEKDGSLLHSQDTAEIEEPDLPIIVPSGIKDKDAFLKKEQSKRKARSYDLKLFKAFLTRWSVTTK